MSKIKHIPSQFLSDVNQKPFTNCKVCDCDLTKGTIPYTIEKAMKRLGDGEEVTLFEVVICLPCAEKQSQKMSKESRAYMMESLKKYKVMEKRKQRWEENWEDNWNKNCLFSGESIQPNDEYHLVGQFQGNQIIPQMTPFIIGQSYIEEMQENLSIETKEEMDRFGKQFLGPDPTIKALLNEHQFVLV